MRADVYIHRAPIEEPVRTSFGTMADRPSLMIRLEDGDGYVGWGEVWCNFPSLGAEHRGRLLERVILPMAGDLQLWDDPKEMWSDLDHALRVLALQSGEAGPISQCLAGFECAVQDLAARRGGVPLYRLLSTEAVPEVLVYASGINPIGADKAIADAGAAGYQACKIKIGFDECLDRENLLSACRMLGSHLSDVSAYGTDRGVCVIEDFWLIVVTEGNADETEIHGIESGC